MTTFLHKFKRLYVYDMMETCFPFMYVLAVGTAFLILGVVCIGLQIACMTLYSPYYYVASGVWVGIYFLLTGVVFLYFTIERGYLMLIITYALSAFGLLVSSLGLLIINIIGVALPCGLALYYEGNGSSCKQARFVGFNIMFIILSVFLYVLCVLYIMVIHMRLYRTMEKYGYCPRYFLLGKCFK